MTALDRPTFVEPPAATRRWQYASAWRRLLRLHFAPITLSAGLLGVLAGEASPRPVPVALALFTCAFAYGVGQVINDYFDRAADAVNAPDRPLVSGAVDPLAAILIVSVVAVVVVGTEVLLAPRVALWTAVAAVGHLMYAATKPIPLLGNFVNGGDIAVMVLVGGAATVNHGSLLALPPGALTLWGLLAVALTGYSLISYFKDIPGDRAAGYRTLPVVLGARAARWTVLPFPAVAVIATAGIVVAAPAALHAGAANGVFWVMLGVSVISFAVASRALVSEPERHAYAALVWYTRGTLALTLALIAAHRPLLAIAVLPVIAVAFELAIRETVGTGQA